MKRTIILTILVIVFASVFVLGLVSNLQAGEDERCSNASLDGRYALWTDGTNVPSGTPVRSVGFATFDGEKNFSITNTVNNNGEIIRQTFGGTYTVNQDCTGHFETDAANWDMVLIDGGEEFVLLRTNPNRVATGIAKKQSSRHEKKPDKKE